MLKRKNILLFVGGLLLISMSSCHRGYGCPNTVSISDIADFFASIL